MLSKKTYFLNASDVSLLVYYFINKTKLLPEHVFANKHANEHIYATII